MKSLQNFKTNNSEFFNSAQGRMENPVLIGESLLVQRGSDIDSIFHKLSIYEYRQTHGSFIHESYQNVEFSLNEQFAARDMLINIAESYAQTLCDNFCEEYGINEGFSWQDIKNGTAKFITNIANTAKELKDQLADGLNELKSKLKDIYEFVKDVTSKAIKSAKELVERFLNMMLKTKKGFNELAETFGEKIDALQEDLNEALENAMKNKSARAKESVYESMGIEIANGARIDEGFFDMFKKKKKDGDENEGSDKKQPKKSEYEDAQGKKKKTKHELKGWKKIVWGILKQMMISTLVLVIIPGFCTFAWGGAAGMIVATIGKAAMSGYAFIKLVTQIYKTVKGGAFKQAKPIQKGIMILAWAASLYLIAWGAKSLASDGAKIFDAFKEGNIDKLVPSEIVQKCAGMFNEFWKMLTGKSSAGYESMMQLVHGERVATMVEEVVGEEVVTKTEGQSAEKVASEFAKQGFEKSRTGLNWIEKHSLNVENVLKMDPKTTVEIAMDGSKDAAWGQKLIGFMQDKNMSGELTNTLNKSLNAVNSNAGSIATMKITVGDLQTLIDNDVTIGNKGIFYVLGTTTKEIVPNITKNITTTVIDAIAGSFVPIIALPDILEEIGQFRLRMGSGRTGNDIYTIQEGKKGRKEMTIAELKQEVALTKKVADKDGNETEEAVNAAYKVIEKNINTTYAELKKMKAELEEKKSLSKDEKKTLKNIDKIMGKMGDSVDNHKCIVFYSDQIIQTEDTKEGKVDESLIVEAEDKLQKKDVKFRAVVAFIPFTMSFIDLVDCRSIKVGSKDDVSSKTGKKKYFKPARKKPIPFKGLFSSYEFLPMSDGMSEKDIYEMLTKLALYGLQVTYNFSLDKPCYRKMMVGKFKVNEESKATGKRPEFSMFTNEEITQLMNDKCKSITDFLGGSHKTDHSTIEKVIANDESGEGKKSKGKNAKERWIEDLQTNEEIIKFIENSKTLKDLISKDGDKIKVNDEMLNELVPFLSRAETNYINDGEKRSLLSRFKKLFGKEPKDIKDKYDSKELQTFVYKMLDLHKKKLNARKKKIQESGIELYFGEYDEICEAIFNINANLPFFEDEFEDYLNVIED